MIVTRFAPSPTGPLHLGHAYAAAFAAGLARSGDGRFLVRIEDLDLTRARPEHEAAIYDDLAWLGLAFARPCWRQSERFDIYRAALARLQHRGLVYPCFCTRKEIAAEIAAADAAPHGPDGPLYPGTCRALPEPERADRIAHGQPFAWRLDAARAAEMAGPLRFCEHGTAQLGEVAVEPMLFGDVVLGRKEAPASYHLAVVVDDAAQGVTLVTRGADLLPAAHVQRVLQALLGLSVPDYAHHRLIRDAGGQRLAKRAEADALSGVRAAGRSADAVLAELRVAEDVAAVAARVRQGLRR